MSDKEDKVLMSAGYRYTECVVGWVLSITLLAFIGYGAFALSKIDIGLKTLNRVIVVHDRSENWK